ncbi:uncharacterized protein LOC144862330 [Branchiostoma floridae x Branchiostoma japonicum]
MPDSRVEPGTDGEMNLSKDDTPDLRCGWGNIKPTCVQVCNNAKGALVFISLFGFVQSMLVNGYVNSSITSIEKRFQLSSYNAGIVAACYDIAYVVLALVVSYHAGQGNSKPKWLAFGSFALGTGAMLFSIPHFASGPYVYGSGTTDMCDVTGNATSGTDCTAEGSTLSYFLGVFILAQLLHGLGATPLYTVGPAYLDENVDEVSLGLYIGIFYAAATIGPAVGYLVGGQFLDFFVDIDIGNDGSELTPSDLRWVGAWWIPFVISAVLGWVLAVPLLGYAKEFPGTAEIRAKKISQAHKRGGEQIASNPDFGKSWRDFPSALKLLLCNPTFMLLCLSGATESFLVAAFSTFGPKYVENQYNLSSGRASILSGAAIVPGAALGSLIGGALMKKLKLTCRGMLKLCVVFAVLAMACLLVFLLRCPNIPFSGVTQAYGNSPTTEQWTGSNLTDSCNKNCNCQGEFLKLTCGADSLQYFSPCHAGCSGELTADADGMMQYTNCTCIMNNQTVGAVEATLGNCPSSCQTLPVFLFIFFLMMVFTFGNTTPATGATLRCVPDSQRPFALGLENVVARLLGSIPGPILMGFVIDQACLLRQTICEVEGACWIYDNNSLTLNILYIALGVKAASVIFYALAVFSYKPVKDAAGKGSDSEGHPENPLYEVTKFHQHAKVRRAGSSKTGEERSCTLVSELNLMLPLTMPEYETLEGSRYRPSKTTDGEPESQQTVEVDSAEGDDLLCGWGAVRPAWVQIFNNSKGALFFVCLFAFVQGTSVNGLVNVSITSIEKRFDLPSFSLGVIKGSYDVAYSILALFVTYHASTGGSKPKWLSLGVFVLGIGSLTFAIPHFVTGRYMYGAGFEDTCAAEGNATNTDCNENTNLSNYFYIFVLAQLIHGLGATPLYTIGVSFLDENVDTVNSGLYIGIFYACAFFGPATGYFFGGKLLDIFTDIYKGNDGSELTPDDPRWVGAWWIGFVVCAAVAWAVSIPLAGYPKELPGAAEINAKKRSEAHQKGGEHIASTPEFGKTWRDFPTALLLLLRNPTFMLINIGGAFEAFLSATFAAFGPKFVQMQFGQPSGRASTLFGAAIVPGAAVGSVLGGLLMKKLKLKCPGMIKLVMIGGALGFILDFALLLSCPGMSFAGVTVPYQNNLTNDIPMTSTNLSDTCNADCNCKTAFLVPTCGANNVQYFSPCFAGCTGESTDDNGIKRFTNCSCVSTNTTDGRQDAHEKPCPSPSCGNMSVFLFLFFLLMVVTIMEIPAATGATLRCVPESQRSLALGVQTIILRFLGSIPGPIVFGKIIDSTCLVWQEKCGERGSCWIYDKESMAYKFLMVALIWQAISLVGFGLALWSYKPPVNTTVTHAKLARLYGSQEPTVTVTPSGGGAEQSSETATPI